VLQQIGALLDLARRHGYRRADVIGMIESYP
jgi:hypothetical protein